MELGVTEISAIVAAAGVLVGVVLTVLELRNLVKVRQTDTLLGLYSTWDTRLRASWAKIQELEFEDFKEFEKKYGMQSRAEPLSRAIADVSGFYEIIGLLVFRRLADISLIEEYFPVVRAWEKLEPIHRERRKTLQIPKLYRWFEYLYSEIKKRQQRGV